MSATAELSEKELQGQVVGIATITGWKRTYHTYDSRRSHSGFPDLVLVRERIMFVELKSQTGKLGAMQKEWLEALIAAGAEAYVIRPDDLEPLSTILAARQRYGDFPSDWRGEQARRASQQLRDSTASELS